MVIEEGDQVRVDIPDVTDPDHERYHDRVGVVVDVTIDDLGELTGDERDDDLYKVRFGDGQKMEFRWGDLRLV